MTHPLTDEPALDLTQRELYEQERRSIVQPSPAEDQAALSDSVELIPSPRCPSADRELLNQPWGEDESQRWRRAPR